MAAKGSKGGARLYGPLYTPPGQSLGPHRVEGPKGGMSVPDPIGFTHGTFRKGPGAKDAAQKHHDKE